MTIVVVVLSAALLVAIATTIVTLLSRKALNAALASLLGLLGVLISATAAPSLDGEVTILLDFGALGQVNGRVLQVNAPQPDHVWYVAFATVFLLLAMTLVFVFLSGPSKLAGRAPGSGPAPGGSDSNDEDIGLKRPIKLQGPLE